MPYLALVRHGESEWNSRGLWTGLTDVSLTKKGIREARGAADVLQDIEFHSCHCSTLKRAKETLAEMKSRLQCKQLPTYEHAALNERDYGDFTGKNKWKIKEEHGEEEFIKIRRNWDHPIPGGETLKDVHQRVVPYFKGHILKDLKAGKNVLVAAHGNSLRALAKHIEGISNEEIAELEIATGDVLLYSINTDGKMVSKEIRSAVTE